MPAGFFYLGEEGGGVVQGHALFAAGEGVVGEGDDEDRGVDLVEEPLGGAGLDLFETGEGFEEEGDVGRGGAHVVEGVALFDGAGVAHEAEEAVEEVGLVGEDVAGEVGQVGREGHPGTGQGMEAAGDVEDGLNGGKPLEELGIEGIEQGQPFVGGGVGGHEAAEQGEHGLGIAGRAGTVGARGGIEG